jgi:D-alanyl-D-alanine dipeptidase
LPTKREKLLLRLLVGAVACGALFVSLGLGIERLKAAREKETRYRAQNEKLAQSLPAEADITVLRDRLKAELEEGKRHFYTSQQMDPYTFGTLIRKKLAAQAIVVDRYRVVELKGKSGLEFSVSGTPRSLILFLKEVSESEKYWTISSLTLTTRDNGETMDAVLRIGYETLDEKIG